MDREVAARGERAGGKAGAAAEIKHERPRAPSLAPARHAAQIEAARCERRLRTLKLLRVLLGPCPGCAPGFYALNFIA